MEQSSFKERIILVIMACSCIKYNATSTKMIIRWSLFYIDFIGFNFTLNANHK